MGELQYKTKNPLTAIAEGLDSMVESGKKAYNKVQEIIDDRRVRQASLALSSINILISSDPVLASCKYAIKIQRKMFPIKKGEYYIDYQKPYHEPCPHHNCKTYRVKNDPGLVWCPMCMCLLVVHE